MPNRGERAQNDEGSGPRCRSQTTAMGSPAGHSSGQRPATMAVDSQNRPAVNTPETQSSGNEIPATGS